MAVPPDEAHLSPSAVFLGPINSPDKRDLLFIGTTDKQSKFRAYISTLSGASRSSILCGRCAHQCWFACRCVSVAMRVPHERRKLRACRLFRTFGQDRGGWSNRGQRQECCANKFTSSFVPLQFEPPISRRLQTNSSIQYKETVMKPGATFSCQRFLCM